MSLILNDRNHAASDALANRRMSADASNSGLVEEGEFSLKFDTNSTSLSSAIMRFKNGFYQVSKGREQVPVKDMLNFSFMETDEASLELGEALDKLVDHKKVLGFLTGDGNLKGSSLLNATISKQDLDVKAPLLMNEDVLQYVNDNGELPNNAGASQPLSAIEPQSQSVLSDFPESVASPTANYAAVSVMSKPESELDVSGSANHNCGSTMQSSMPMMEASVSAMASVGAVSGAASIFGVTQQPVSVQPNNGNMSFVPSPISSAQPQFSQPQFSQQLPQYQIFAGFQQPAPSLSLFNPSFAPSVQVGQGFATPQFAAPQFAAPQFAAPQFVAPQFVAPQFAQVQQQASPFFAQQPVQMLQQPFATAGIGQNNAVAMEAKLTFDVVSLQAQSVATDFYNVASANLKIGDALNLGDGRSAIVKERLYLQDGSVSMKFEYQAQVLQQQQSARPFSPLSFFTGGVTSQDAFFGQTGAMMSPQGNSSAATMAGAEVGSAAEAPNTTTIDPSDAVNSTAPIPGQTILSAPVSVQGAVSQSGAEYVTGVFFPQDGSIRILSAKVRPRVNTIDPFGRRSSVETPLEISGLHAAVNQDKSAIDIKTLNSSYNMGDQALQVTAQLDKEGYLDAKMMYDGQMVSDIVIDQGAKVPVADGGDSSSERQGTLVTSYNRAAKESAVGYVSNGFIPSSPASPSNNTNSNSAGTA